MDIKKEHFASVRLVGILMLFLAFNPVLAKEANLIPIKGDSTNAYSIVEKMPQIIGGISELYESIEYPKEARDRNIEGKVFVQFIVDVNGNVTEPKVLKDIGFGCGDAAIAAIRSIKFTPGMQDGVEVPVNYTLPVMFRLKD